MRKLYKYKCTECGDVTSDNRHPSQVLSTCGACGESGVEHVSTQIIIEAGDPL